jgi:multisubunit Na+/H+ antiporter MnhE subunit
MDAIRGLLHRPIDYYNVDGMGELAEGLLLTWIAAFMWLQFHVMQSWGALAGFAGFIVLACISRLLMRAVRDGSKAIKARVTYPQTGFVQYRAVKKSRWPSYVMIALVCSITSYGGFAAMGRHLNLAQVGVLAGLALAIEYLPRARAAGWKWAVWAFLVAGAIGVGILPGAFVDAVGSNVVVNRLLPARLVGALLLVMLFDGVILLLSGAISFVLFVARTSALKPEAQ